MTIKDTFTPMADQLRKEYGVGYLLSTDQVKFGINGLSIKNYFEDVKPFEATFKNGWIRQDIADITLDTWNNNFLGKVMTISFDATWSGYQPGAAGDRFFLEFHTTDVNNKQYWFGLYHTPDNKASDNIHLYSSFYAPPYKLKAIECYIYDELNTGSVLKLDNFKLVINPMGGHIVYSYPDIISSNKYYMGIYNKNIPINNLYTYFVTFYAKVDTVTSKGNEAFVVFYSPDEKNSNAIYSGKLTKDWKFCSGTLDVIGWADSSNVIMSYYNRNLDLTQTDLPTASIKDLTVQRLN